MHLRRFRKVDGLADHTFHARSYSQMPALDVLGVAFAWAMHVGIQMSDVCAPIIGVAAGEPAGLQQCLELHKDLDHLPDIMPPKVATFTRQTSQPRNGSVPYALWRCPRCLPTQYRFPRQEQARCPLYDASPHVAIFP